MTCCEFLPTLIASIRQLCYAHFDFNECIEIVGILCLEFDKARKENFSINECVQSGGYLHVSNSSADLPNYSTQDSTGKSSLSLSPADYQDIHNKLSLSELETSRVVVSTHCPVASTGAKLSTNVALSETPNEQLQTLVQDSDILSATSSKPFVPQEDVPAGVRPLAFTLLRNGVSKINSDSTCMQTNSTTEASSNHVDLSEGTTATCQQKVGEEKPMDSSICSESEPSLEIDIENMDTSHEEDSTNQNSQKTKHLLPDSGLKPNISYGSSFPFVGNDLTNQQPSENGRLESNKVNEGTSSEYISETADRDDSVSCHQAKTGNMDLPLDMSVLKPIVKKELDVGLPSNR